MKEHNKWVQLSHSSPKYITGIVQEYSIILPVYISSLDLVSHKQKEFVRQLKISIKIIYLAKEIYGEVPGNTTIQ